MNKINIQTGNNEDLKRFRLKDFILMAIVVIMTIALIPIGKWTEGKVILDDFSPQINQYIVYQLVTLLLTFFLLLILWRTKRLAMMTFFRLGDLSAEIMPEPRVGIKPKSKHTWLHYGINFAIVITAVTIIVIYFQLVRPNRHSLGGLFDVLPFSILFAISNAFVEESITRLGVVVVLKKQLTDKLIPLVSATLFGLVHFFGHPGGVIGVIVAGFLGWLLAKSIIETRGMFWAWLIHFLQDVVIFSALLTIG